MRWNPFSHLSKTRHFATAKLICSSFWERIEDTFKVFYGKWTRNNLSDLHNLAFRLKMGLLDYLFLWQKTLIPFVVSREASAVTNNFHRLLLYLFILFLSIPFLIVEGIKLALAAVLTFISLPIIIVVHAYCAFKKEKLVNRIENLSVRPCMDEKSYRIKTVKSRLEAAQAAETEVKELRRKAACGLEGWAKVRQIQNSRYRPLDTPDVETREEYLGEEETLKKWAPALYDGYTRNTKHGLSVIAVPLRKDNKGKYEKIQTKDRNHIHLYVMEQGNESEREAVIENSKQSFHERPYRDIIVLVGSGLSRTAYFYHHREPAFNETGKVDKSDTYRREVSGEELIYLCNEQIDNPGEERGEVDIALSVEEQNYLINEEGWVKKNPQDPLYHSIVKKAETLANHPFYSHTCCDQLPDALGLYEFQRRRTIADRVGLAEDNPKPLAIIPIEPKNYPSIRAALKLNSFWSTEKLENHPLLDIDQFVEEISKKPNNSPSLIV